MTGFPTVPITCDDFDALFGEYLEDALDGRTRHNAEAHVAACARCRGLVADLVEIRDDASRLPVLKPTHDLWDGIAARTEAPEIQIAGPRAVWRTRIALAAAAAALVATTAVVTWNIASSRTGTVIAAADTAVAPDPGVTLTSNQVAATYDDRISEIRRLLDSKPGSLDSATMRVLAINLRVIDDAISRVRTALDSMPSNALLSQKLQRAYEMKLNTLKQFAAMTTE